MPDGPHILWLLNATKSASHACTSVDVVRHVLAGVDDRRARRRRGPRRHSSATGVIVPSTLLIAVNAEHLGAVEQRGRGR